MPKLRTTKRPSMARQRKVLTIYEPRTREEIDEGGFPWDIMPLGGLEEIGRLAPDEVTERLVWAVWDYADRTDFTILYEARVAEDLGCRLDQVAAGVRWLEKIAFVETIKLAGGVSPYAWKITQKYGHNNEEDTWKAGKRDLQDLADAIRGKAVFVRIGPKRLLSAKACRRMADTLMATVPALPGLTMLEGRLFAAQKVARRLAVKPHRVDAAIRRFRALGLMPRHRRSRQHPASASWKRLPGGLWITSFRQWIGFRIGPSPAHRAR